MDTRARLALAAFGVASYAVVSHQLMTRAAGTPLALIVILGPMAAALVLAVWQFGQRLLAGLLALAAVAGALASLQSEGVSAPLLYVAQHAGTHAALALWFGSTLRHGRRALITQVASRVHALSPAMQRYTRRVTQAWTLYFIAMTALSCGLFAFAPFPRWSLFANVLTPLSLAAMFVVEHWLRYRLHPEFERVGLVAAVRAFSQKPPADLPPSAAMGPRR